MTKNDVSKIAYIYGLACPTNNKIYYIGKSVDPHIRYKKHLYPCELNQKNLRTNWLKSILKKGKLPKLIILKIFRYEDINEKEIEYISRYRIINPELKNDSIGGDGHLRVKAIRCSNGKTYSSIIEASKDLCVNNNSISSVLRGKSKSVKGLKFFYLSKKDKKGIFILNKKRIGAKEVYCSNGKRYESVVEAAKDVKRKGQSINAVVSSIGKVCSGVLISYNGLRFSYVKNIKNFSAKKSLKLGKIYCSNGKTYNTAKEAANDLGLCYVSVAKTISGKQISSGGYTFRAERGKSIIVCSNGKRYETAKLAEKDTGVPYQTLLAIIKKRVDSYKGIKFWEEYTNPPKPKEPREKTKIKCSNGKEYDSLIDAAKDIKTKKQKMGTAVCGISQVTKGHRKYFNGYTFTRVKI